ncbi:MAG: hypothetical protein OXI24_15965, partial [Candidatus Poribacteria bacterium]|nr:hypothetical protein [Candidatus Poribacteria bacterium]
MFCKGADISPKVLSHVSIEREVNGGESYEGTTIRSPHYLWRNIGPQRIQIPINCVKPLLGSRQLIPFGSIQENHCIVPVNHNKELLANPENYLDFWRQLEDNYFWFPGYPQTLLGRLNRGERLSRQLRLWTRYPNRQWVSYPRISGEMRATRSGPKIFDSTVIYCPCGTVREALYLVGLLNSELFQQNFNRNHFQRFFDNAPILNYDVANFHYLELVDGLV